MSTPALFLFVRILIIGLLLGIQYYCYRRMISLAESSPNWKKIRSLIIVMFLVMNIPLFVFLFWIPKITVASKLLTYCLIYPFYLWHFTFLILAIIFLAFAIAWLPFKILHWGYKRIKAATGRQSMNPPPISAGDRIRRRNFLRQGATLVAGAALTTSAYGAFKKDDYEVSNITIPIANLPIEFEGFSIALISDIHSSVFMMKEKMDEYVNAVNELSADLITVTGDFVNSQVEEVYPFAEAFSGLRAPHGIFGVLGNHDYYTRNVEEVAKQVENCGIKLLVDSHVKIEKEGKSICLLGSDDIGRSARAEQSFDRALKGTDPASAKILMCHRPYFFETAAQRGIDLVLSGHTHGGQVVFLKFNDDYISPARMASKYVSGLYTIGSCRMYVSRGVGTVGVPIRINCPPEITKFVLTKG